MGGKGGNSPSVQSQEMSAAMETALISQINQSVKVGQEAWDRFQKTDMYTSGESIERQMNMWRYEAQRNVKDQYADLTKKMPEKVPGLAQSEEAINKRYGDIMADTKRASAVRDPYGSARSDSMEKSAEFARAGDIANTRGTMTKGWDIQRQAIDKKNTYDWVARMTGTNPVGSSAGGMATSANNSAMSRTQSMLDIYNDRMQNEVDAANSKDAGQANTFMNVASWFV